VAPVLLLAFALACGKYGPPLRAGQAKPEKSTPRLEVPLPLPPNEEPPAGPATHPEAEPEVEQEPPLEGAP
jgi:hypothetical protein